MNLAQGLDIRRIDGFIIMRRNLSNLYLAQQTKDVERVIAWFVIATSAMSP